MNPLRIQTDFSIRAGLVVLAVSFLLFCSFYPIRQGATSAFPLFLMHYFLSVGYGIHLLGTRKSRQVENRWAHRFLLLLLFLISAYALNREMAVFQTSPFWLSVLLVASGLNFLLLPFWKGLPQVPRIIFFFLLGISFQLFLYLALYLLPYYSFSFPALVVLGLSIHTFVPLLFCISIVGFLMARCTRRAYGIAFGSGLFSALTGVLFFAMHWSAGTEKINRSFSRAIGGSGDGTPVWVQVARSLEPSDLNEKILKTGLVYSADAWNGTGFFQMPSRSFGEEPKIHDPLVVLATLFSKRLVLGEEDRIHILKTVFNGRLQSEERLWTGIDLSTEEVGTQVEFWPSLHLAFTEKTVTVYNRKESNRWSGGQEAIYHFQLPAGGVVTSLSLWINGREEKGILTTKEKADSAYKTIVGREVRDPSVVHWQEGNRVSVRVFPVMPQDNRVFRVGITAPLREKEQSLVYENISIEGPDVSHAQEWVTLHTEESRPALRPAVQLGGPESEPFYRGKYRKHWTYTLPRAPVRQSTFFFGGSAYTLQAYQPHRQEASITDVYLDLNQSWTLSEWEGLLTALGNRTAWIYADGWVPVRPGNRDALFRKSRSVYFSLFPFHALPDPAHSLVVSKTVRGGPALQDLRGSDFWKCLKASAGRSPVRLFHLGDEPSAYLSSLREYRFMQFESGRLESLQQQLRSGRFKHPDESEDRMVLAEGGISISRQPGAGVSDAPDHLMRLFAYNHILQTGGRQGMEGPLDAPALVEEARAAQVVTPYSSLVVLETAADYKRFDIRAKEDGLGNAALSSKGAVPEPHEWMLILLAIGLAFLVWFKTR